MIGDPIGHSLSPAMHSAAFNKLGLKGSYKAFQVKATGLGRFMKRVRREFAGVNVTIPHKIGVMRHLDKIDAKAREIGAVNTVVNRRGKLFGFNTDVEGVRKALEARKARWAGKKVFVVGAGGAGRAVVFALAPKAREIVLMDRNEEKAAALAREASRKTGRKIRAVKAGEEEMGRELADAGVLVNASNAGMKKPGETPVPKKLLKKMIVMDVVYNPLETRLVREAKKAGCKTVTGELMLAFQGAKSFELFTGKKAPAKEMLKAVRKGLGK